MIGTTFLVKYDRYQEVIKGRGRLGENDLMQMTEVGDWRAAGDGVGRVEREQGSEQGQRMDVLQFVGVLEGVILQVSGEPGAPREGGNGEGAAVGVDPWVNLWSPLLTSLG